MEALGWIGAVCFAVCGIPQALQSVRDGHSRGLNWGFLGCWLIGEVLTIAYVWPKADWPLLCNYIANLALLLVMLRYKVWERK